MMSSSKSCIAKGKNPITEHLASSRKVVKVFDRLDMRCALFNIMTLRHYVGGFILNPYTYYSKL